MTTDVKIINKELNNFEEVEIPYKFILGEPIKYITLKNDKEFFYKGGYYCKLGNEKITRLYI